MFHLRSLLFLTLAFGVLFQAGCSKESRARRYLDRADGYFQDGEYAKAEVEYLNALRLNPAEPRIFARLGIIYHEQGRLPRAYAFITRARELVPEDLEVRLKSGMLYLTEGKLAAARAEAELILSKQPTNQIAVVLLAESARTPEDLSAARDLMASIRQSSGDTVAVNLGEGSLFLREREFARARGLFQRALEIDPANAAAHHALAATYLAQNDRTNAGLALSRAVELAPPRSNFRLHYADFLAQGGDPDAADALLAKVTTETPDFLPAWIARGELALGRRQLDECKAMVAQAMQRDGEHPETMILNARVKLASVEVDDAIKDLDRFLTLFPKSPSGYYHKALALLMKDDAAEALRNVSEAVLLNPNYDEAVLLQAQLNIRRNDTTTAVASLRQLIQRRPNLVQGHLLLVGAHRAAGDMPEALAVSRRMEERFPGNAQIMLLTAALLREHGRLEESRRAFERILEVSPGQMAAVEQLVDMDIEAKRPDDAMKRVQEQLASNPQSPELHFMQAKVHFARQQSDDGEASLLKAIELNPDYRPAYLLLARAYVSGNKHPQAIQRLREILSRNPKDAAALMQLAMIHSETKDHSAARDTYEQLLAIAPRSSVALNNLAYIYSEHLPQLNRAFEMARRARQIAPGDPYAADTLGWILFKRGEYPWALALLQESAERLPNEPEVQFHLGMTQYMMGYERPARLALERAARSERDFRGKDEAARRLAILNLDLTAADAQTTALLEKTVTEHPEDLMALLRLARIYERQTSPAKAVELYERVLTQNPKNVPVLDNLARLHAYRLQNPARAMQLARAARDLAPEDPGVAHTLGRLAFDSGEFAWSLSLLQESDRRLPRQPEVLFDLAWANCSVGRMSEANDAMRTALEIDPGFPRAEAARRFVKTIAFYLNPEAAQSSQNELQALLQEEPGSLPALAAAGLLQRSRSETAAARKTFEQILQRYTAFAPAHKHLAALYILPPADVQKAYDHGIRAREAFPRDSEVARNLGIISYLRKEHARAAALLRESAVERPSDAELLAYLGMAQFELKQNTEARQNLRNARALNLDPALAAKVDHLLTELQ